MSNAKGNEIKIEGALPSFNNETLPTAQVTRNEESITNNSSMPIATAVPVDYFQNSIEIASNDVNSDIPFAPSLRTPEDSSPEAQAREVSQKARLGTVMGSIYAHEEKDAIKKISSQAQSKPCLEKERIQRASEIAKQRNREGLNVTDDRYFKPEVLKAIRKQDEVFVSKGGKYDVSEYDTKRYETTDYETTEYKSVYD